MTSCPRCGFDLKPDAACAVCGYDPRSAGQAEQAGKSTPAGQTGVAGPGGASAAGSAVGAAPASRDGHSRSDAGMSAAAGGNGSAPRAGTNERAAAAPRRGSLVLPLSLVGAAVVILAIIGVLILTHNGRAGAAAMASGPTEAADSSAAGGAAAGAAIGSGANGNGGTGGSTGASGAAPVNGGAAGTASSGSAAETAGASAASGGTGGAQTIAQTPANSEKTVAADSTTGIISYESSKDYRFPVGASPQSTRATTAVDLYDPATQPVFDLTQRTDLPPTTDEDSYVKWMLAHTDQSESYVRWRWQRAHIALANGEITHPDILMAFLLTPREWFVRRYNLNKTYDNTAIPIGYGQTISGPELVAHMTNALDPQVNQRVLEIGTGSGYQSAFLSELSNYVYTIEIVKPLADETNQIYLSHTKTNPEYANVHRRAADGYYGWPEYAPFDRIIVTTGIDHIPPELLKELAPNGIMLIPVGPPTGQIVLKITKTVDADGSVHLTREDIFHGYKKEIFVPFTAATGGTHNLGEGATGSGSSGGTSGGSGSGSGGTSGAADSGGTAGTSTSGGAQPAAH